jgi:ComF family protein
MWHPVHVPTPAVAGRSALAAGQIVTRQAFGVARRLFAGALDLALPPSCPGCRRPMGDDRGLCVDCWSQLQSIEEPWCERLGTPLAYDLGPGTLSAAAIADPPAFDRARSAVIYGGIAPDLVHAFKYADRTELAALFAAQMLRAGRELLVGCDAVVPIPLHRWRLFSRRFNQAALLARAIGRLSGAPVVPSLLERVRATRQQVGLSREARALNMRGVFQVPRRKRVILSGLNIVLVDDVFTTGATLEAAARVLKRSGARRVDVLTFARVVAAP